MVILSHSSAWGAFQGASRGIWQPQSTEGDVKRRNQRFDIMHYGPQNYMNYTIVMVGSQHNGSTRASIMSCSDIMQEANFFIVGFPYGTTCPCILNKAKQRTFLKQMLRQLCGRVDGSLRREGIWTMGVRWQGWLVGLCCYTLFFVDLFVSMYCLMFPSRSTLGVSVLSNAFKCYPPIVYLILLGVFVLLNS